MTTNRSVIANAEEVDCVAANSFAQHMVMTREAWATVGMMQGLSWEIIGAHVCGDGYRWSPMPIVASQLAIHHDCKLIQGTVVGWCIYLIMASIGLIASAHLKNDKDELKRLEWDSCVVTNKRPREWVGLRGRSSSVGRDCSASGSNVKARLALRDETAVLTVCNGARRGKQIGT